MSFSPEAIGINGAVCLFTQDGEALPMGVSGDILSTSGIGGRQGNTHGTEEQEEEDPPIFEKHDQLLHGKLTSRKIVSSGFMKRYIHIARAMKPVLTREACDVISTEYAKLRAQETAGTGRAKTQPVTARTLETLIRLATAHAKARLSKRVELVWLNLYLITGVSSRYFLFCRLMLNLL